ncbi:hypothetical protein [Paenibacillus durus]|uniref:Uncharacterized protein n=1 Tax=Paenibacillus durus ATCC 35681 TaxID=1333534 RepID=A0A0F7F6K1_PAEDU|nr:hypothetical protein [Paenibacillus durus]AKG33314.1 hypothetical protein VK70_00720 [Paenibacillus durus ATCC 35681]
MSIYSFLEAAEHLYDNNFYEEAFCLVCVAIDASAQRQYPDLKVGERYKKFISSHFEIICNNGFPGISASSIRIKVNVDVKNLRTDENGYVGMEDIIYHIIRCGLVHDCVIDQSIKFIDSTIIGDWVEGLFFLPKAIIIGLINAVKSILNS